MTLDKQLLREAIGIAKIAYENGYSCSSAFSRYIYYANRIDDIVKRRDYFLETYSFYIGHSEEGVKYE